MKEYFATVLRALRSRSVLSSIAGFGVFFAIRRGWIPDMFFTQALEGLSFLLAAIFRVVAVKDIQSNVPLNPHPPVLPKDVETVGSP